MAGIGRPKGTRRNATREQAVKTFNTWRAAGYPIIINEDLAHNLTGGLVGEHKSQEPISLAAVALRYEMKRKAGK